MIPFTLTKIITTSLWLPRCRFCLWMPFLCRLTSDKSDESIRKLISRIKADFTFRFVAGLQSRYVFGRRIIVLLQNGTVKNNDKKFSRA